MKITLKNIAVNILAVLIFITVPSVIVAIASGYEYLGEAGIYLIIVLSLPFYLLNNEDYKNVETKK